MSALNIFKTVTLDVTTSNQIIYTAPALYSGIILMAQITNITNTAGSVTLSTLAGTTETELLKDFSIPGNDAASGVVGKLVIESGNSIKILANANDKFKITLSILESANG
jgi:hypothetical protein